METQTWLSRHYKFVSAKNIIVLSVSSRDFLHAFLEVAEQQMSVLQPIYKYNLVQLNRSWE